MKESRGGHWGEEQGEKKMLNSPNKMLFLTATWINKCYNPKHNESDTCAAITKPLTTIREGVQISASGNADADQSGPDFFQFHFNRYRLKRNRQRVKLLHRANYRHHQFLTLSVSVYQRIVIVSHATLLTKIMLGNVCVKKSQA